MVASTLGRAPLAPLWYACIAVTIDLTVLTVAFWFAQYVTLPPAMFSAPVATATAALAAGLTILALAISNSYRPRKFVNAARALVRLALALTTPVALGTVVLPINDPTAFVAEAALVLLLTAVPLRFAMGFATRWIRETGLLQRRAVIAGGGIHAEKLIKGLAERPAQDVRVFGIFDDRDDDRAPLQSVGVPKIGGYDDLIRFVRASEIDMVIVTLPLEAKTRIDWLLERFKVLPVDVRLSAFSQDFDFAEADRDPLISAIGRSFAPRRRLTKRAFDLMIASVAIVLLSPLMIAAALAIKLESRGPVIFRQKRHGYNHRVVEVLKFRSMYAEQSDPEARQIVTKGDPRVTKVGRILRRTSIDELPQLFNVLWGDLSLVGPRPHAVNAVSSSQEEFSRIVDGYSARHRLPPGITGWAQINGWRGEIDEPDKLRERFEHDLFYIENWSIWLDIQILWRTPLSLVKTDAAY